MHAISRRAWHTLRQQTDAGLQDSKCSRCLDGRDLCLTLLAASLRDAACASNDLLPGHRFQDMDSHGCVLVAGPFLAFSLVWAIFGLLVWTFLLPCGIGEVHLHFLLGVPFMTALAIGEGMIGHDRAVAAATAT